MPEGLIHSYLETSRLSIPDHKVHIPPAQDSKSR